MVVTLESAPTTAEPSSGSGNSEAEAGPPVSATRSIPKTLKRASCLMCFRQSLRIFLIRQRSGPPVPLPRAIVVDSFTIARGEPQSQAPAPLLRTEHASRGARADRHASAARAGREAARRAHRGDRGVPGSARPRGAFGWRTYGAHRGDVRATRARVRVLHLRVLALPECRDATRRRAARGVAAGAGAGLRPQRAHLGSRTAVPRDAHRWAAERRRPARERAVARACAGARASAAHQARRAHRR